MNSFFREQSILKTYFYQAFQIILQSQQIYMDTSEVLLSTPNHKQEILFFLDTTAPKQSKQTCRICQIEQSQTSFYSMGCAHKYCRNCLLLYIDYKLSIYQPINCCFENCNITINHQKGSVYHLLSKQAQAKVDVLLDNYDRMINIRKCKQCEIGSLIEEINSEGRQLLRCQKCKQYSCYNCFNLSHNGECTYLEDLEYPPGCSQCRKCRSVVLKDKGCNHMKCLCGYEFCFKCGYHWTESHICAANRVQRRGFHRCCCFLIKSLAIIPIAVFFLLLYILYVPLICLLSSIIFTTTTWLDILTNLCQKASSISTAKVAPKQIQTAKTVSCCTLTYRFFVIIIWMLTAPLSIAIMIVIGILIPFWNICNDKKIVFSPRILFQLWDIIVSWMEVFFVI